MKQLVFSIVLLSSFLLSNAQTDSFVQASLFYQSEYEEAALKKYFEGDTLNYSALILALNPEMNEEQQQKIWNTINETIEEFTPAVQKKKSLKRKVTYIYKQIHKRFFKKYDDLAYFDRIFSDGHYNCLTGSALYALIFEKFDIPHVIKAQPTHVYIIVDPGKSDIIVEATTPSEGLYTMDNKSKKKYVEYMAENKIISKEELETKSTDELFSELVPEDETVTLMMLAGFQFYNAGMDFYSRQEYDSACNELKKAWLICKDEITYLYLISAYADRITGFNYAVIEEVEELLVYYKLLGESEYADGISSDFAHFTQKYFLQTSNYRYYHQIYDTYIRTVKDSTILAEVSYMYYSEQGRIQLLMQNMFKSEEFLLKALTYKPESSEVKAMLTSIQLVKLSTKPTGPKLVEEMDSLRLIYPFLSESGQFNRAYCETALIAAQLEFIMLDSTSWKTYVDKFEEWYTYGMEDMMNGKLIEEVFYNAWRHYWRKGDKENAKKMARRGSQLYPYSEKLLRHSK